jgi:hypothetical protein
VNRAGLSLVEVLVASAILIVVVIVITGLFGTTDEAYRTETPLREAQVRCQAAVDAIAREIQEGSGSLCWAVSVQGESLPAGADRALLFASARGADGNFVRLATTLEPVWQRAIAYIPLRAPDATVSLYRFDFGVGSLPGGFTGVAPRIVASASAVSIEWRDGSNNLIAGPVSRGRLTGIGQCPDLAAFALGNPDTIQRAEGGTYQANVWTVGISGYVNLARKRTKVSVETNVQGRNR